MRSVLGNISAPAHRRHERHPVSCEIDGEVFSGYYWVAGMILVVSTAMGGTSRQLGNRQADDLAKELLRDLLLANRERATTPPAEA